MNADVEAGIQIYNLIERLFPITRSLTGKGVRDTLDILRTVIPEMEVHSIPSGEHVLDWVIPHEWNISEAYIIAPDGRKVVDFKNNNLHVMGYSTPVRKKIMLDELKKHLHTLPEFPDWTPFIKNYYNPDWGFCMPHRMFEQLEDGEYEVVIDSKLQKGVLNYGELYKAGQSEKEFLITCYICHPSMANDSLSGVGLSAKLAREILKMETCFSYRFLFIPETIGSIAWLAKNKDSVHNIRFGLVATCLGDPGSFTYKKSRRGDTDIDKICTHVLRNSAYPHLIEDFFPLGSDERQFCSPGFNLPVGSLMRTRYHNFDEYHTSADDMDFITSDALGETYGLYKKIIMIAESNFRYLNQNPSGEPNLGKHGLFKLRRVISDFPDLEKAYFWTLNLSDGNHDLVDISNKSGIAYETILQSAKDLGKCGLLEIEA